MASGFTPDEIAHEKAHWNDDKGPAMLAGSILLIGFAAISTILRLLARRIKHLPWMADDYVIIAALLFAFGMFVSLIICIEKGLGRHILRVGAENAQASFKALYVLEAIYPACTTCTKISILLLYRRIFTKENRTFNIATYIIAAVLIGWAISGFFTTVFQCLPVERIWLAGGVGEGCIQLVPALLALAIINTLINGAVLILPIPTVWRLQMSRRNKIAVCGILILGSADVLSSIIRTYMTSLVKVITGPGKDVTWIEADAAMLALVEPCLGIICACLPVMRPIFSSLRGTLSSFHSSRHSTKRSAKSSHVSSNVTSSSTGERPGKDMSLGRGHGWMELGRMEEGSVESKIGDGGEERPTVPERGIRVTSTLRRETATVGP